jgi:hypothetical protein
MLDGMHEVRYFDEIAHWSRESKIGDRSELTDLPENLSFWSRINAKSELPASAKSARISSHVLLRECVSGPRTQT